MSLVKCISIWQPWAQLCVIANPEKPDQALKTVETRSWSTRFTGRLLIHAGKRWTKDQESIVLRRSFYHPLESTGYYLATFSGAGKLPLGAIVGEVTIVDCWPTHQFSRDVISWQERAYGDFSKGRYGWIFENPILYEKPIPYQGQQGLFGVDPMVVEDAVRCAVNRQMVRGFWADHYRNKGVSHA